MLRLTTTNIILTQLIIYHLSATSLFSIQLNTEDWHTFSHLVSHLV